MKRSLSNDDLKSSKDFKAIKCIISDGTLSPLIKFQNIQCIAKKNFDRCCKVEKEKESFQREKENNDIMKKWFNNAMKLFEKKNSQKEFLKEENALETFGDDLQSALEKTQDDVDFWYCEYINLNFGDRIPCDKDDCWYETHSNRIGEFGGDIYHLRFTNEKIQLCDICYVNCAQDIQYDKLDMCDIFYRFYEYLENKWGN